MNVRPARPIVAGASVDPDAGRSAGGHGLLVQFRELARGFPWAWDEEVVVGAARLPERQSARLAAAFLVAEDALAEVVLRRDVPQAAGPERDSSGAKDVKAVVAQASARWKAQASKVQQVALPRAPPERESQPVLAQLVSQPGLLALALLLAEALQAQASPPQAPLGGLQPEQLPAR